MYENMKRVMVVAEGKKKGISNKRYLLTCKTHIYIYAHTDTHTHSLVSLLFKLIYSFYPVNLRWANKYDRKE